jgi:putative copper export protein
MATTATTTSTGKYWLYFLIAFVIFMFMLIFMNQWFWVSMPFMLTFLVMALGFM